MPVQGHSFFPADSEEFERLENVHRMAHALMGSQWIGPVQFLLSTPTLDGRRRQVLDAGAGTGSWVREMAAMFPSVDFRGLDIVPVPPPPHIGPQSGILSEASGESSLLVPSTDDDDEQEYWDDQEDTWREEGEWDWVGGSETTGVSPIELTPSTHSWDSKRVWEEKPNVRFEMRNIISGLGCPTFLFS